MWNYNCTFAGNYTKIYRYEQNDALSQFFDVAHVRVKKSYKSSKLMYMARSGTFLDGRVAATWIYYLKYY